jgi:hypothetical protein
MDLPRVKEGGRQNSPQFRAVIKSVAWNYKGIFFVGNSSAEIGNLQIESRFQDLQVRNSRASRLALVLARGITKYIYFTSLQLMNFS